MSLRGGLRESVCIQEHQLSPTYNIQQTYNIHSDFVSILYSSVYSIGKLYTTYTTHNNPDITHTHHHTITHLSTHPRQGRSQANNFLPPWIYQYFPSQRRILNRFHKRIEWETNAFFLSRNPNRSYKIAYITGEIQKKDDGVTSRVSSCLKIRASFRGYIYGGGGMHL